MEIRVLHLVHWLNRGGIENWLLNFLRFTDRQRVAMDFCCRGPHTGAIAGRFNELGAMVHHCPLGWNHASFGRRLGKLLRDGGYDILHVHAGAFAGYPCIVGHRSGASVVTTFHSTSFAGEMSAASRIARSGVAARIKAVLRAGYGRWSVREACRNSDIVIPCSQSVLAALQSFTGGVTGKFHVLPCGTPLAPSRDLRLRHEIREELQIDQAAPVVVHIGTLREAKNHAGLLRIADTMRRSLPDFRLIIAGGGPLLPAIEQQIRELNLQQTVKMLGPRDDVGALLDAGDLMVFPSLWEGLPVSVVEAHMKGLPVVGSDIGPMREATVPGRTAILFPVHEENQMAAAAIDLLIDEPRRREMGAAATEFARGRFSIDTIASEHYRIYESLVRERESHAHPSIASAVPAPVPNKIG